MNAEKISVQDDLGTDFYVNVKDRKCGRDYGLITDNNIQKGILGSNLPAGEIGYATHEEIGEGTLICPLTNDPRTRQIIKNLELKFKKGKLIIDKTAADTNVEDFINTFKYYEEMDKASNFNEIRTYNMAELGIGCNPNITHAIGYVLTDEKISGTVHIAFGLNNHFGGTSKSNLHWDFVTLPKANITIKYIDGSERMVMENGLWLF